MSNCRQACPYNTPYGCKVKEYNKICPLTNMATPVTGHRMTNAEKIRSMSDEKLSKILGGKCICPPTGECEKLYDDCATCWLEWLQQPAETPREESEAEEWIE